MRFKVEDVAVDELQPHPRNYRVHPPDQIEHIEASIRKHGFYRNVVVAEDCTILAGHGVVTAAKRMGYTEIPVRRLSISPDTPQALEILAGDNEVEHLGEVDDRMLTEILKEVRDSDPVEGLLGTGYDDMTLANRVMVTRHSSEIQDVDHAAHWVGLPDYDRDITDPEHSRLVVHFASAEDRDEFAEKLGVKLTDKASSIRYPPREDDDYISVRFEG